MKRWLTNVAFGVAVGVSFAGAGQINSGGLRMLAFIGASGLLNILFVQKYPKSAALEWVTKLKPGQKIEVEGK